MALKLLHPSCFVTVIHHPGVGTIIECAPRTVTKLNCPKEQGREELNFDCFSQVIPKVEHAVWRDSADYLKEDRSSSTLHSNKLEVPEPRAFKEPSFRCCNNIIVLSHNVPYEQQQMICPTCHTIWQVLGVQDGKAIVKETGKAPRGGEGGEHENDGFDPNGGGCPPPPGAGCG